MTTYGTIPTSSSPSTNLEFISRAKQRIKSGLGARRPWKLMFNFRSFSLPSSLPDAISRLKSNIAFFRMNYAIIFLLILFLSLLWHPISLIVFVLLMALWLFLYFLRDEPLVLVGRLIDDRVVLIVMSVVTIVVLLLTDVTLNVVVAVLIGVAFVIVHGVFRRSDDLLFDDEEASSSAFMPPSSGASPSSS